MKLKLFNDSDLKTMEAAIDSAEKLTSGEIVTLILSSSSDYWLISLVAGTFGALVGSGLAFSLHWSDAWGLPFDWALSLPILGFLVSFLTSRIPSVTRALTPRYLVAGKVHREALAHFTALGVSGTRDRTGVLLLISELERRVVLLADQGIHAKKDDAHWKTLVDGLVTKMKEKKAAAGVVELIEKVSHGLIEHFPRKSDDTNELKNRVLVGRQY